MTASSPAPSDPVDTRSSPLAAALSIARRDLLEFVRDRRTLFVTLLLPMVTYPIVALSSALGVRTAVSDLETRNAPAPITVATSGPDAGPLAARIEAVIERGRPEDAPGSAWPSKAQFLHGPPEEAIAAVEAGAADVWIDAPAGLVAALDGGGTVDIPFRFPSQRPSSRRAREQFEGVMHAVAEDARGRRVAAAGLPGEWLVPLRLRELGGSAQAPPVATETLVPALTAAVLVLLSVLTMTGAFYPAIDAIAGEKERGTVETLLMAPCSAGSIVFGKFLAVWAVTLATLAANCLSIAATAGVGLRFLPAGSAAPPGLVPGIAVTIAAFVGLAAIAAATCLAVTTASKSGKEAQNTLTPVILLVAGLAGSALVPGLRGSGAAAVIPFAGQVMLARDALSGAWPEEAAGIALGLVASLLSAALATWLLLRVTAWLLADEDVLFRGPDDVRGGLLDRPAPRALPSVIQGVVPVIAGIAALWYVQGIAPRDLLLGIPVQQGVAVLLPLAAAAWWQRVDARATFALGLPGRRAAGAAAIGGGVLLGAGTFLLSAAAFLAFGGSEPSAEVRALSERIVGLVRERPWWVSAALVSLLPAVAEESLFRGWALAALAGKNATAARTAAAVTAQAGLFALAHLLPERMPATFLLGLVAGTLRIATGSLLPSIACHAAHNAVPLVLVALAGDAAASAPEPLAAAEGAAAGLAPFAAVLLAAGGALVLLARRGAGRLSMTGLALVAAAALPTAARGQEPARPAERVRVSVASVGVTLEIVDGKPTGASVALWEDLANRVGIDYEYVVAPSLAAGLDAAATGDVDLFLGPVAITREREQRLDFTHSVFHSGLRIAVRDDGGDSGLGALDILLSWDVLRLVVALLALTVVVGHLLWWFERDGNERSFPRDWPRGTWEGTWWGISTLITGGCDDKHVDTVAGRILATLWMLVGICLVAVFTGSVAASLTAERITGEIHGPRDLAGREIGTQASGVGPQAIRARAGIPVEFDTLDEVFVAAGDGELEAVVAENLTLKAAITRPGRSAYRVVGPVFDTFDAGIALRPGSDLRERLNAAILAMREDGALDAIIERWLGGRE